MSTMYSKKQMKPLTIEDGEDIRIYKGFKLNARTVATESFKILKAITPSLGAGVDSFMDKEEFDTANTFASMGQLLNMNLTEEHFEDLCSKTLGNIICNGEAVQDWGEHFDEYPQDMLEVISWAGMENFHDFFMRSGMLRTKLKWMKERLPQEVTDLLNH